MFLNNKRHCHYVALIEISSHVIELVFSDIFPDPITDNILTGKSGVMNLVRSDHELMSGCGFSVRTHLSPK